MPIASQPAAPLLLMSAEDNCLIARVQLAAGAIIDIDGVPVALQEDIPLGYKVARRALRSGDKVLRYGALIGSVTTEVARGAMLHTHNLASDYIPTYTLGPDAHAFIGSGH
ncbi:MULTISPECIES: UxaA family hydrolase [unclassified Duganella]|uniref:UxaA family hydrolase n=1 Tax=unclassified Duganella TaxID=2636909 RepID=UPI0006F9E9F0|nr:MULTISPECIES: UxaA family hydrolase [unclassified Duganella]KQV61489.1 hydrolase [Duganella sp. Root336D2]KRB92421.1 hydrolase [Duganella sp. Root198D2]